MAKNHMKRLTMPKTWLIDRKNINFVTRPASGKDFTFTIALGTFLKEVAKVCDTNREVTAMYNNKKLLVNGVPRYDVKFPVGLFDVVTLVDSKQSFRLTLGPNGRLTSVPVKDTDKLLCRIKNKTTIRGGKVQLNCFNGTNVLVDKDTFKTGDSIVVTGKKVATHIPLQKGNVCLLINGKHGGTVGTIENVEGNVVTVKTDKGTYETPKDYAFVVGTSKPEVTIGEAA